MLTDDQWASARAMYEAGSSMGEVSREYGVSVPAVSKRAKKEGWCQDTTGAVLRHAEAKVNGVVNTVNPEKRAQAIDAASDKLASVINRHRDEWQEHESLLKEAIASRDFATAKLAKITAETIAIRQAGERKAWGITDKEGQDKKDKVYKVVLADEEQEF